MSFDVENNYKYFNSELIELNIVTNLKIKCNKDFLIENIYYTITKNDETIEYYIPKNKNTNYYEDDNFGNYFDYEVNEYGYEQYFDLNTKPHNSIFYKIKNIDLVYLCYQSENTDTNETIYHCILYNYNLIFTEIILADDIIQKYVIINNKKYEILNDDIETIFNNNIIKVSDNSKTKLLGFYNYNDFYQNDLDKNNSNLEYHINFIIPSNYISKCDVDKIKSTNSKFHIYKYSLIDTFENNYILKDVFDALIILSSCIIGYNDTLLIKLLNQIKNLINNSELCLLNGEQNIIHLLFHKYTGISVLFVFEYLFTSYKTNNYNIKYYNNI